MDDDGSMNLYLKLENSCTVYSVQCTVYSVQCTVCSVQCTVYSVHSVQCTAYSVQCTAKMDDDGPIFKTRNG